MLNNGVSDVSQVTCGIKTLARPESLTRLLTSIYKFYPTIRCVVVDDSLESNFAPGAWPHVTYIRLPHDSGLGAGRNVMIDAVETPYCLYLDDDHVFEEATNIRLMQEVLEKQQVDLVGGQFREEYGDVSRFRQYHGRLKVTGDILHFYRDLDAPYTMVTTSQGITTVTPVDITNNFFLAITDKLRSVRWDDTLKINTHVEFFLRAKHQMEMLYCPDVHVFHTGARSSEYTPYRVRPYWDIALKKHGIKTVKYTGRWR